MTAEEAKKVLDACPNLQWRLIFALCRYGGLRCPSELLSLKWTDVNWERRRITIHSPKTERYQGKDMRQIPIFPELRPYLQDAFDLAKDKSEYVITLCRKKNTNLRTCFKRIILKAHIKPWPKLFQNLRSSRETELTEKFPLYVVCAWMGNSQAVAAKHYLQVTDDHFQMAAGRDSVMQNQMQHTIAPVCAETRAETIENVNPNGCTGQQDSANPHESTANM